MQVDAGLSRFLVEDSAAAKDYKVGLVTGLGEAVGDVQGLAFGAAATQMILEKDESHVVLRDQIGERF